MNDNIIILKAKEVEYLEEIEDCKYKTKLILTELKKTGKFEENNAN